MTTKPHQLSDTSQWVDLYADEMFGFAYHRVSNRSVAEDMVQQALLSAMGSRDKYSGQATEKTWLFSILKNKCLDHLRTKNRERSKSQLGEDQWTDDLFDRSGHWKEVPGDWNVEPGILLEKNEFWGTFDGCLEKLPQKMAQAFALKVIDGEKSDLICEVMNITPDNLWALLHRARMRLRECLEQNWFDEAKSS